MKNYQQTPKQRKQFRMNMAGHKKAKATARNIPVKSMRTIESVWIHHNLFGWEPIARFCNKHMYE